MVDVPSYPNQPRISKMEALGVKHLEHKLEANVRLETIIQMKSALAQPCGSSHVRTDRWYG